MNLSPSDNWEFGPPAVRVVHPQRALLLTDRRPTHDEVNAAQVGDLTIYTARNGDGVLGSWCPTCHGFHPHPLGWGECWACHAERRRDARDIVQEVAL